MNLYGHDLSLFDFGFSDPAIIESISHSSPAVPSASTAANYDDDDYDDDDGAPQSLRQRPSSPPKHRHDGTSPLPLGMDWSPPPRKWDGRQSAWPHDFHTGWSYCVTIPSWVIFPKSRGSDPVVFYRVQIGVQSTEGITTTRGILRRFSDFLKLFSELQKMFPKKDLPPAPPKRLLRMKSRTLLEERRSSLEDWMEKLLSDIDLSRSFPVANFLELEAAARSSFYDTNQDHALVNSSTNSLVQSFRVPPGSDVSASVAATSSFPSDYGDNSACETSDLGTPRHERDNYSELGLDSTASDHDLTSLVKANSLGDDSFEVPDGDGASKPMDTVSSSEWFPSDLLVALPSNERIRMNRVLVSMQQRLATAKTDMEDLIARLNQELAVRQYLTTKVKDLEVELETAKESGKENLQQTILIGKERSTQMQWDMEELKRNCMEMELKLKSEQEEKARVESTKVSIIREKEMLLQDLDGAREQLVNMHKYCEELESKSKAGIKLLVKEVKSLRSSQMELKQELSRLAKEKSEVEKILLTEKQRREHNNAANAKLLHECEILQSRLEECSVNFLIEEENKLIVDTSSPSDAIDLLTTSDNRIGFLLAEAQLLAQDIETALTLAIHNTNSHNAGRTADDELRKMLTDVFIDNARLRKQVNSVLRCALSSSISDTSENDEIETTTPPSKTVLSKFWER